jgi:hypothetical protein
MTPEMRQQPFAPLDHTRSSAGTLEHTVAPRTGCEALEKRADRSPHPDGLRQAALQLALPLQGALLPAQGVTRRTDQVRSAIVRRELVAKGVDPEMNRRCITRIDGSGVDANELTAAGGFEDQALELGPITSIDVIDDAAQNSMRLYAHPFDPA